MQTLFLPKSKAIKSVWQAFENIMLLCNYFIIFNVWLCCT